MASIASKYSVITSGVQKVSGRYKILYLDTFLCICIVSRYIFQKSIVSVSYRNFFKVSSRYFNLLLPKKLDRFCLLLHSKQDFFPCKYSCKLSFLINKHLKGSSKSLRTLFLFHQFFVYRKLTALAHYIEIVLNKNYVLFQKMYLKCIRSGV